MALDYKVRYPGQIITSDPLYPYGKARNVAVEGDGTGTPWTADVLNDIWGFLQSLLSLANITPTGVVEALGASQYKDALDVLYQQRNQGRELQTWTATVGGAPNALLEGRQFVYSALHKVWLMCGNTDECALSYDDGLTWLDASSGMTTSIDNSYAAHSRNHDVWVVCGNNPAHYARGNITSAWGTVTPTGATNSLGPVVYDPGNQLFILAGLNLGPSTTKIWTSPGSGISWTDRSAGLPAGYTTIGLASMASNETGDSVITGSVAATDVLFSADGVTYAKCTTVLVSDTYSVGYNPVLDKFMLWGTTNGNVYTSSDGDTWTLDGPAALATLSAGSRWWNAVGSLGEQWVVGGDNADGFAEVRYTPVPSDLTTWETHSVGALGAGLNAMGFADDGANEKVLVAPNLVGSNGAIVLGSQRIGAMG